MNPLTLSVLIVVATLLAIGGVLYVSRPRQAKPALPALDEVRLGKAFDNGYDVGYYDGARANVRRVTPR